MEKRNIIENAAELCMRNSLVPTLVGDTGVGKSEMIQQIAEKNNKKLIELNLATQETADLIGIPYKGEDGMMHWSIPCWWPTDDNTLIFIDEINRNRVDVLRAIMPMLLTKRLHVEHILPRNTWIAAAMNPDTEDFDMVVSIDDDAFNSRLVFLKVPEPSNEEWKNYLNTNDRYNDFVYNLVSENPEIFNSKLNQNILPERIKPSRRSLTKFSSLLNFCLKKGIKPIDELILISRGFLGQKASVSIAREIETYFEMIFENTNDLTNTVVTDENIYITTGKIIKLLNNENIENKEKFVLWLSDNYRNHKSMFLKIIKETKENELINSLYFYKPFLELLNNLNATE
jgi:hypothetical protein